MLQVWPEAADAKWMVVENSPGDTQVGHVEGDSLVPQKLVLRPPLPQLLPWQIII